MEIILFFIAGLSIAFIGALPLGTVNLAVINSSISKKNKSVKRISYAAGISEVVIALFAYTYGKGILTIIKNQFFLQYAMVFVLFGLGVYFLLKKKDTQKKIKIKVSDFGKGILLGLANPSVWVYWIVAISLLESEIITQYGYTFRLVHLIIFFIAIYLGKIFALFMYGKIGRNLNKKNPYKNTIIGSLLILTATIQLITQLL